MNIVTSDYNAAVCYHESAMKLFEGVASQYLFANLNKAKDSELANAVYNLVGVFDTLCQGLVLEISCADLHMDDNEEYYLNNLFDRGDVLSIVGDNWVNLLNRGQLYEAICNGIGVEIIQVFDQIITQSDIIRNSIQSIVTLLCLNVMRSDGDVSDAELNTLEVIINKYF